MSWVVRGSGRRATIEPVISHMKSQGHLGRNCLKGCHGDHANTVLTATGYNFRFVLRWLRQLLCKINAALIATITTEPTVRATS